MSYLVPNSIAYSGPTPRVPILTNAEAWARLPATVDGTTPPLPIWARMLAAELPRTTAAMLELDYAHRILSPVPSKLRAAMRWVAAQANRCHYTMDQALTDARAAGVDESLLSHLIDGSHSIWNDAERQALRFALDMTVDSDAVSDEQFADLVKAFGEKQTACMVLLMAYANFQDRLLLSLGVVTEKEGPFAPLHVRFSPDCFVFQTTPPPKTQVTPFTTPVSDAVLPASYHGEQWQSQTYEFWQQRMAVQKERSTRLSVLPWSQIAPTLPAGLMKGPTDIVWYQTVFGYAPELAVPFEIVMRTAGAETSGKWDRIFGSALFWITTKAVECPYCMGHCEMNWEVAGLNQQQIEERSRLLSDSDWSSFPVAEQHAYAFARKLAKTPWEVTDEEIEALQRGFGPDRALILLFHASRHHYMTRISNGFQLTLEKENVFYDYYNQKPAEQKNLRPSNTSPAVTLLSDEDCWRRLPQPTLGWGKPLPSWARAIAVYLPRTAAAMLLLDYAHRTKSAVAPVLRAKMRWVIADANRCEYSKAYAVADLKRSGATDEVIAILIGNPEKWPEADRKPLEFVRLLTTAAATIPDRLFEDLRQTYGEQQVASMVMLAAYGNFQDRIVLGLQLPMEQAGPLAPLEVAFVEGALQMTPFLPATATAAAPPSKSATEETLADNEPWNAVSWSELQQRLHEQKNRIPRLPIPTWEEVKAKLPPTMVSHPIRIVWNLVAYGYVPELAIPWSTATRTLWSELPGDRIFEESLFWVQTQTVECRYCMGHCEMLLEVAGLDKQAIADRTQKLASQDWSAFPPEEQRAYAYARRLTKSPWTLTADDYATLVQDFGEARAMSTFWWLCRGLYMTRISDGFQLPLEKENVFYDLSKK